MRAGTPPSRRRGGIRLGRNGCGENSENCKKRENGKKGFHRGLLHVVVNLVNSNRTQNILSMSFRFPESVFVKWSPARHALVVVLRGPVFPLRSGKTIAANSPSTRSTFSRCRRVGLESPFRHRQTVDGLTPSTRANLEVFTVTKPFLNSIVFFQSPFVLWCTNVANGGSSSRDPCKRGRSPIPFWVSTLGPVLALWRSGWASSFQQLYLEPLN